MFGVTQEKLVAGLSAHQSAICGYGPHAATCDCKYGAKHKGEQCGCPEVRMASALISKLTEKQFESACKKAGIVIFTL